MSSLERLLAGVLLLIAMAVAGWFGIHHYGAEQYQSGYAAAVAERAKADSLAVAKRTGENAAEAVRQVQSNATITEKNHEELAPVRERIITKRVYVGSAVCGDGPPAPAQAESAGSSNGADSPGRLVRSDVERDLVALKLRVEEAFGAGRSCQDTLRARGMAP